MSTIRDYNKRSKKQNSLSGGNGMQKKALVVIDIQKDITKNYKEIIDNINQAVDWAVHNEIPVVYIRHENLSPGTRTFKPNTAGADAAACVKSTCYNMCKANYGVYVLSDCITSYDKNKIEKMLNYYESKGCKIISLCDLLS